MNTKQGDLHSTRGRGQAKEEQDPLLPLDQVALKAAEAERKRLYEVFMQVPASITVQRGPDLVYELVNPIAQKLIGKRDVMGKSLIEAFPEIPAWHLEIHRNVYATGQRYIGNEFPSTVDWDNNGRIYTKYFNFVYEPLLDESGNVDGLITFAYEVPDPVLAQQKAEEASKAQLQLAAIVEFSDDAIIGKDLQAVITSWNQGAEKTYGYRAEEVIGKPITILTPPDRVNEIAHIMEHIRQGRAVDHLETVRVSKGGSPLSVSLTVSPIKNAKGEVIGASTIAHDITERKRIEHNLQFLSDASKILSSSLDYKTTLHRVARLAVPEIADWCTVDMKAENGIQQLALAHVDPNKVKWAKALNAQYPPDPHAPTGVPNVLRTGKAELYAYISEEQLLASATNEEQVALIKKIGFSSAMIVPLTVAGETIGAITFVSTELKRHYTQADVAMAEEVASRAVLAIENARLYMESQKAVSLRDEFISVASHELKTPVTSLKMYTQGLQRLFERRGEDTLMRYLKKMDAQVDKLTILIADLLNVSKLQVGRLEYYKGAFDLNTTVKEIVESIQPTTKKHHIIIEGEIKQKVWGDKDRIGQVIINLLTNAIKYSPQADRVIVRLVAGEEAAIVAVQDFGIGIDKEHQRNIFKRFYRVTDLDEKTFPGLGIGLYISNEIIKNHHGKLTVTSRKGKGSMFRFTLSYQRSTMNP